MVEQADVVEGCRAVGFTLGVPGPSMLGVVDDMLVDRAFVAERRTNAQELASVSRRRPSCPAQRRQRAGGRRPRPRARRPRGRGARRAARVPSGRAPRHARRRGGRRAVRRRHARPRTGTPRRRRCSGYEHVVWIAGGQAKGQTFDDLVRRAGSRLRGVVLLGVDRAVFAACPRATRAGCPRRRGRPHRHWCHGRRGPRGVRPRAARATPCCSRRAARPGTCSATTATAATRSPQPSAALAEDPSA